MKESTIHLVYQRQYYDDEDMDYFFINYTIFRNLPLSQLTRLNNKEFKQKVKEFCDKNYKETASNYANYSEVNMIHGSEYYKTYADEFGKSGSVFHEHPPKPGYIPGVEAATGSLGHGMPMALGMALGGKILKDPFHCYASMSDGECNEGTIWEAAMLSSSLKLNNLIGILDYNKWQATGRSKEIMNLEPLDKKWDSFGWNVQEIDGHDFKDIKHAFISLKDSKKPNAIIAHTVKGKGVSFMEDDNNWHYRIPTLDEVKKVKRILDLK